MHLNQQALLADHTGTDAAEWTALGTKWEHKKLWLLGTVTLNGSRVKVEVENTDPDSQDKIEGYEGDLSEPYLKRFLEA